MKKYEDLTKFEGILRLRVDSCAVAASRSRWVFGALSVASVIVIVALYCMHFGELSALVDNPPIVMRPCLPAGTVQGTYRDSLADGKSHIDCRHPITEELHSAIVRQYSESLTITVPILGLRIPADDVHHVAPLCLLVLSVWLFLCVRRENHLIGSLFTDIEQWPIHYRAYAFHGVVATQLFTSVTESDRPLQSIGDKISKKMEKQEQWTMTKFAKSAMRMVTFFPAIAIYLSTFTELELCNLPQPLLNGTPEDHRRLCEHAYGPIYEYFIDNSSAMIFCIGLFVVVALGKV